ncbi:MAG: HNH endonuclease [Sarcina sp.]
MRCEVCNARGDIHHIVHRRKDGLNFELNYKYLCHRHHRGLDGPHRNKIIDYSYKLEMQNNLYDTFTNSFYTIDEINNILKLSISSRKKIQEALFLYKEGYKNTELIFFLMGKKSYSEEGLEDLDIQTAIWKEKAL